MPTGLAFVDKVDSASVVLDLNDQSTLWLDEFSAPPPPLRRQLSSSLLTDGARVSASSYDNRELTISWALRDNVNNMATKLQAVARQLDKEDNWLRWTPQGSTKATFFRTLRSTVSDVVERYSKDGIRIAQVTVMADPFGYGEREDLSAVTITADPSTGSNRLRADLGTVIGDVESPSYIWRGSGGFSSVFNNTSLLACETGPAVSNPPVLQAESATAGTDTATSADALASGGSKMRTTFSGSTTLQTRVDNMFIPTGGPGIYRLFARVASTSATGIFQLQYADGGTPEFEGDLVTYTANTANQWSLVDLGLFQLPPGVSLRENGLTGLVPGRSTSASGGELRAARLSASGSLDIDYILAIPVSGQLSFITANKQPGASGYMVFDAYADDVVALQTAVPLNSGTQYVPGFSAARVGGLPLLTPGVTNRLWFIDVMGYIATAGNLLTQSVQLNVSYWPRYLYARPAAT